MSKRVITKSGHFEQITHKALCHLILVLCVFQPLNERDMFKITPEDLIENFKFSKTLRGETNERYVEAIQNLDIRFGLWHIFYDKETNMIMVN